MITKWNHIIIKILCILLFIFIFYKLTDETWFNTNKTLNLEAFENSIEKEKIYYIKLKETYIDNSDVSLNLLYANYLGEETGHDVWENKTLDQCTDICNNIDGCIGFSRDLKLDTEKASCYPNNIVNKCYSNRKGNMKQMQNAIKYNSFIKSDFPNILTLCIGDKDLTLNRKVFIKSYSMPKSCLGVSGDSRIMLIDINTNNFIQSCNFRIVTGLDGVGTVSFLHLDTGKYIFRDARDSLILYDNSSGITENNQRSSFNIYDSSDASGSIMFKSMSIEGETTDKFIMIDDNYLTIKQLPSDKNKKKKDDISNFSFYIIDSIVNSNIITNKSNMPINTNNMPINTNNMPINTKSQNINIQEEFTVNLDSNKDIPLYNNLFSIPDNDNFILQDYLTDNFIKDNSSAYTSITNKYNDIIIKNQLSKSLTKSEEQYKSLKNLNIEIEKEISNLNLGLNAKNDRLINGLDKMKITDMSNDYFFLQNLMKNKQISK